MANTAANPFQGYATTSAGGSINTTPLPQSYPTSTNTPNFSGLAGAAGSILQGGMDMLNAVIQRRWNEKMYERQKADNLELWHMTNEYNSPVEQLKRLREAGLNPLNYGLDGTSASQMEAPQPLGYERASMAGMTNPVEGYMNAALKEAQVENINADTTKKKEETNEQTLINEFLGKTMEARVEGETLKNDLTKAQIAKIGDERHKIVAEIDKIIAETESEAAKKLLYEAETTLKQVEAARLVELLPLEKELIKAKTQHEKAAASLAFVQAAYQKHMLSAGYIETMINEMNSRIDRNNAETTVAEQEGAIKGLEKAVREGNPNDLSKWFDEHPWAKAAHPALAFLSGDCFKVLSDIEQSCGRILGPLLAIFGAGKVAGGAAKAASSHVKPPTNQYSYNGNFW